MATSKKVRLTPQGKAGEKQLLGDLLSIDGYFAEQFTGADFNQMYYNIDNDFPIFLNVWPDDRRIQVDEQAKKIDNLERLCRAKDNTIEALSSDLEKQTSMLQDILDKLVTCPLTQEDCRDDDNYIILSDWFSPAMIILSKLKAGMKLDSDELRFVATNLLR